MYVTGMQTVWVMGNEDEIMKVPGMRRMILMLFISKEMTSRVWQGT
jgi:hypothetical protein